MLLVLAKRYEVNSKKLTLKFNNYLYFDNSIPNRSFTFPNP